MFLALPDYHIVARVDAASGLETLVAGNGISGYSGDGGPATSAQLQSPSGVAVDSAGNLYISDSGAAVVRKVSSGVITTVAGTGTSGSSGDGGPATSARLAGPSGIAVDASFNLFIADTGNNSVRKVSGGIVTTMAGGLHGPLGVAVDALGNIYIADAGDGLVRKLSGDVMTTVAGDGGTRTPSGGNGDPATGVSLGTPGSVAVDSSGKLYIADFQEDRVWVVANGVISAFAGNGGLAVPDWQQFVPAGVAAGSDGSVYIADSGKQRVLQVSAGIVTVIAGRGSPSPEGDGGPAIHAQLYMPSGVAADSSGNLYIADTGNNVIRMVSQGAIPTVAGNGTAGYGGDGGPAPSAQLASPVAVAVDGSGNLYIADAGNYAIRKVSGGVITTVAESPAAPYPGCTPAPTAVAADSAGAVYFNAYCEYLASRGPGLGSQWYSVGGTYKIQSGSSAALISGCGGRVYGLAVDSSGDLFCSPSSASGTVDEVSGGAMSVVYRGSYGSTPHGISVDGAGSIWIADPGLNEVLEASHGAVTTLSGSLPPASADGGDGGPAASARLNGPMGVAVDASGRVYIADTGNNRIRVLLPPDTCAGIVNWNSRSADDSGGSLTASILINPTCSWSITNLPGWVTASGAAAGSGPSTVTLVVAANPGPPRTVNVAVAGSSFTLTQAGATYTVSGHVTLGGQPLAGVFLSLGPGLSAATDATGYYSIAFPAASSAYTLSASLAGYGFIPNSQQVLPSGYQTYDFTAWATPVITSIAAGFASATLPAQTSFAPGEIVSIFGTSLCAGTQAASAPLPETLSDCSLWFDGTKAPLYFSSPGQINAVLKQGVAPGTYALEVWRYTGPNGAQLPARSASFPIRIAPVSMAFVERADGGNTVLAVPYPDGGYAGAGRPVAPGDTVTLYLTGLGAVSQQPQVLVEGTAATLLYAGAQPQDPGLDEIVLQLPRYALAAGKQTAGFTITAPSVSQTVSYQVPAAP